MQLRQIYPASPIFISVFDRIEQFRFFARNSLYLYPDNTYQYYNIPNSMQQSEHHATIFTSDLYQFTCSYAYFLNGRHQQSATFEVFFRKYPFGGKYAVVGGFRAVKQFLDGLELTQPQVEYLKSLFPHMKDEYFDWLRVAIKGQIKVKAFREGDVVFAKEPIITYTGPIGVVQLLETPILNLVGFASLVATNASRLCKAVEPKKCIQFGIRRAQGPDGALTASQFAYLGGFAGTSNIHAAKLFNIPCYGTMSHAFVTSFAKLEDLEEFEVNNIKIVQRVHEIRKELNLTKTHNGELAAFVAFAKSFPNNFVTLIDTYSALESGLLNTVVVAKALIEAGFDKIGVRLDSGDLAAQSKRCREAWSKYFPDGPRLNILASDDLHEQRLVEMAQSGHEIDVFAIGTHIATCKKQPALGLVCKLVELDDVPKMKKSEDHEKATLPANKSVYRVWTTQAAKPCFDLISLEGEKVEGTIAVGLPGKHQPLEKVEIKKIELLNEYWSKRAPLATLQQCREHFNSARPSFSQCMLLAHPKQHRVLMTQAFLHTLQATMHRNQLQTPAK